MKKKLIVVDDNPVSLTVCEKVLKQSYEVFPESSAAKLFERLKTVIPDLILLDVEMPVMNGHEAMNILKADENYRDIPVIFLSALDDAQSELKGLDLGAVDYIHKPIVGELLVKRVGRHISIIEGRAKLSTLNASIDANVMSESEVIRKMRAREEIFSKMGKEILAPLGTIIELIETAISAGNSGSPEESVGEIMNCLGKADIETRTILEIVKDVFEIEGRR